MWPAETDDTASRPLAARWPRAVALALACAVASYALLLAVPQLVLTHWSSASRPVREVAAAAWFSLAFVAIVAALVRLQRPGRGDRA